MLVNRKLVEAHPPVVSIVSMCLVCDSALRYQLHALRFGCVLFVLFLLFVVLSRTEGEVGRPQTSLSPPVILLLAVPMRLFCLGFLVGLDVVYCHLLLFFLYINRKIGKNIC